MPVEPVPCASDGGGGNPVDLTTCCAPSITAEAALCRADGTPVLLVVRSGCAECDQPAPDPQTVGWIDAGTGAFTPGAPPADAGPCEAGCVDTVCVQRCDDTTGDGTADTTYSELWCVRADGTAELVLTYRDDPSTPYTPTAPVECTYGCPETETIPLCDEAGPFLRRYTFLAGTAAFEDVELDGQTPHIVQGDVGVCAGDGGGPVPCAEPTTPAATVGLCLADGTPIAVVVTRDCAGDVVQDGWLNLVTGAYTTGPPPAGAMACGDSRAFELAGILCDVDPATGDVYGLVLVEYEYNPDGSLAGVRLVDPATGATYTLQGELRRCPADSGGEQPEQDLTVLCDTAADGTTTAFVRDYRRDAASGAITGHSDYALDGTPYAPAGTVGQCAEPCRDTTSTLLCDVDALDTLTVFDPAGAPGDDGWTVTSYTDGGCPPPSGPAAAVPFPAIWGDVYPGVGPALGIRADQNIGPSPCGAWTGYDTAPVRWVISKTFTAPEDGTAVIQAAGFRADGAARVRLNGQDTGLYGQWNQPATGGSIQVPVVAGANTVEIEVRDVGGPNFVTGHLDIVLTRTAQFMRRTVVDCVTGQTVSVTDTTLDGQPYTPTGEVGQCEPVAACCEPPPPETRVDVETGLLCLVDDDTGAVLGEVLAERVYDDQTGERTEQRYVDPVTGDPVTVPAGASVAVCPPEPCRDSSTLLLCDLPTDGDPDPAVTDTDPVPYTDLPGASPVAGSAAVLWSGGSLTIPPDTVPAPDHPQRVRTFAATVQAPRPACDTGTATLTATIRVERTGPDDGCGGTGRFDLRAGGTTLAMDGVRPSSVPVGTVQTLTVSAQVPAAELAAGNVVLYGLLETYHLAPTTCPGGSNPDGARVGGWTVDEFTCEVVFDQTGCAQQILANVVTDCDTGQVSSITYTTLDGAPYTPAGTVGQCTPASPPSEPCPAHSVLEQCRCDDTDGDGTGDTEYIELLTVDCTGQLTTLGTYTCDLSAPYAPVSPVDCAAGSEDAGAPRAVGVQARRIALGPGEVWSASSVPTLQSVTAVAHGAAATVTTEDGPSPLHASEAATWSVGRDTDALLTGPLTIAAGTGTVTISWTQGVTL